MLRLDLWRRLFHHSALGLASACLLYAEAFFLPGPLLVGLYLLAGVQVLAFAADGRRWVLPSWAANLLAGAVGGGGVAWITSELSRPDSVLAAMPLPAGLLPYIGPMLIGLLVIKLFRPAAPRDFWLLQGVGALQVALACVLVTNPESGLFFAVLLATYLACALGRLALHYFEEEERIGSSPVQREARRPTNRLPFAYLMLPFCLRWSLAAVALAMPFFLITPRLQEGPWDSSIMAASSRRGGLLGNGDGFSQQMDLNRDGPVRLTDEEVFRAAVRAAPGQPLPTLPADQYWRGGVLDAYDRGRWTNLETKLQDYESGNTRLHLLPRPRRYYLDFTVGPNVGGFVLAEPVLTDLDPNRWTPVQSLGLGKPLFAYTRGPVLPRLYNGQHDYAYRQSIDEDNNACRTPTRDPTFYTDNLRVQYVPKLMEWTSALLKRLAADPVYKLNPSDLQLDDAGANGVASLPVVAWERVGKALSAYLANSGEYGYTLDLRRQDTSIDPVMDFLVNTKQGHCGRFASALALMLRSKGIPSRVIVGFHGAADPVNGVYVIRQKQAHAWVEMLKHGPPAKPDPLGGLTHGRPDEWVRLDPTPASEATAPIPYSLWEWWRDSQRTSQELWGGLVVNYTADVQADLWTRLTTPVTKTLWWMLGSSLSLLTAGGLLTWTGLRWRRRTRRIARRAIAPAAAGYDRLLRLLARHAQLQPRIGETPREFARQGRRFLLSIPAARPFADLPDDIVERLYRVRFGGHTLTEDDAHSIAARLNLLAAALNRGARDDWPTLVLAPRPSSLVPPLMSFPRDRDFACPFSYTFQRTVSWRDF